MKAGMTNSGASHRLPVIFRFHCSPRRNGSGLFRDLHYVAPEHAGAKPYSLLYTALRKTGYVAIAQIAMHRREHVAVIRAGDRGILMHTMFYANEVRKEQEFRADTL